MRGFWSSECPGAHLIIMQKRKSIFLLREFARDLIYSEASVARLCELTENDGVVHDREQILANPERYADVEIVFSGWGAPVFDEELLKALPGLKALFYGAGSVRSIVTEAFWERDIVLTSAYKANGIPVAEFTVSMINLSLKRVWQFSEALKTPGGGRGDTSLIPGVYKGSRVGVISLGAIGRMVCEKMSAHQVDVFAYDPFANDTAFAACGAQRAESLDWIFSNCDVVSLHAPWLPETENLITGELLRKMPEGSTFINTSRGMIVDEAAMIEVLQERKDLFAVVDVIRDESDYSASPLANLPNALLTPHISGSVGRECKRMGDLVVDECTCFLLGDPQLTPLTRESAALLA